MSCDSLINMYTHELRCFNRCFVNYLSLLNNNHVNLFKSVFVYFKTYAVHVKYRSISGFYVWGKIDTVLISFEGKFRHKLKQYFCFLQWWVNMFIYICLCSIFIDRYSFSNTLLIVVFYVQLWIKSQTHLISIWSILQDLHLDKWASKVFALFIFTVL